jgi:hypothetical protein
MPHLLRADSVERLCPNLNVAALQHLAQRCPHGVLLSLHVAPTVGELGVQRLCARLELAR